jgi:hypothetical protein
VVCPRRLRRTRHSRAATRLDQFRSCPNPIAAAATLGIVPALLVILLCRPGFGAPIGADQP